MSSEFFQEINKIKRELKNITGELDDISNDVRTEFKGVGNDRCSQCVREVSDEYKRLIKLLGSIDYNDVD